jgi:Tol biopolymer transport system component
VIARLASTAASALLLLTGAGPPVAPHGVVAFHDTGAERRAVVLPVAGTRTATPVGPTDDPSIIYASLSPDRTRLAYVDERGLWLSNLDGSARVQLDTTWKTDQLGRVGPGVWSPDSRVLAFTVQKGNADELVATLVDSHVTHTLLWKSGFDIEMPAFSPDGSTIAFMSRPCCSAGPRYRGIYVVNADGAHVRHLVRLHSPDGGSPTWSPDGRTIAFLDDNAIFTCDVRKCRPRVLRTFAAATPVVSVAWSPTGDRLAVDLQNALYVLDLADGRLQLLSRTALPEDPLVWR